MGTDAFGRDVLSRLLYGGQVSLISSLAAALISVVLGAVLGGVSGYYARWMDVIIMRLSDVFLAMPWLYLLLAARAALPLHMDPRQSYLLLAALMGLVGWARPARLARGIVLSVKEAEYVTRSSELRRVRRLSVPKAPPTVAPGCSAHATFHLHSAICTRGSYSFVSGFRCE